jgi:hypothetical protein
MGFGCIVTGVMVVTVVLMMYFVGDIFVSWSLSESSELLNAADVGSSVGDGGAERVVAGGVWTVDIVES